MTDKQSRFILAQAANAAERIACMLERMAETQMASGMGCELTAEQLEVAASDLAHHADAIREASGITADTEANLATLLANPSTR
jgi:hypothetical protein